MLKENQSR